MKPNTKKDQMIAKLAELNRRFRKYERAANRLKAEYAKAFADMDDQFVGIKKAAKVAYANFNLFRRSMPETKFDMATGEYFLAEEDGLEVFAVRVRESRSCVLRVTAKNAEEAKEVATQVAKGGLLAAADFSIEAEDVSC